MHAGTKLATLQLVDDVYDEVGDGGKPLSKNINVVKSSSPLGKHRFQDWSDDLKSLYDRSCVDLSTVDERNRLAELLDKHKSTFAASSTDFKQNIPLLILV